MTISPFSPRVLLCSIAGVFAFAASGCSRYVFKHEPIWGPDRHIVSVDAKQRAIIVSGKSFCSEPSPDVFLVVAQALSFGGTFGRTADPKAVEAALQAAFSSAEQGSTIPRTQTVNMLRELMFRTCERYLNGGYDSQQLSVQAVRDQRLMVSILAIEQLTGAVTPRPVTISASASSSQGGGGEGIVRLDEAKKELTAAEKARATAQEAFNKVDKKVPGDEHYCKTLEDAEKTAKEDESKPLTEEQKAELEECRNAQKSLTAAKDRETTAREHHSDLRRLSMGLGGSTATETSSSADGGLDQGREIDGVVDAVREIVGRNFTDGTEVMLFCLGNLKETAEIKAAKGSVSTERTELENMCLSHLKAVVDTQKTRAEADKAEAEAAKAKFEREVETASSEMRDTAKLNFESAWPQIERKLKNRQELDALVAKVIRPLERKERAAAESCLRKTPIDKQAILFCYGTWNSGAKRALRGEQP